MRTIDFISFDDKIIKLHIWDKATNPIGAVQIVHGVAEHGARYGQLAKFFNDNGFIAVADDHRAHGLTRDKQYQTLHDDGNVFKNTVRDERDITAYIQNNLHPKVVVFGHSYGSFILQDYIQQGANGAYGFILSGSAHMKSLLLKFGVALSGLAHTFKAKHSDSKLIYNMSLGSYDKRFKTENIKNAWLSRDATASSDYNADEHCGGRPSVGFYKYFFKGLNGLYNKKNLAIIDKNVPLFIISGTDDPVGNFGVLPVKLHKMYTNLGINAKIKMYPKARHSVIDETNKDEVLNDILDFSKKALE